MVGNRTLLFLLAFDLLLAAVILALVVAIYLTLSFSLADPYQAPKDGTFRGLQPIVIFPNQMIGKDYVWVTINGNTALLWKGRDPQPNKNNKLADQAVARRGDRLILYDKWRVPEMGSVFIPILGGNALRCLSCEDRLWPTYWERVD